MGGTDATPLANAANGFNELKWMAMLWTVQHRWPVGMQFAFNCYGHYALLSFGGPATPNCHAE